MSLRDLIQGSLQRKAATATHATLAIKRDAVIPAVANIAAVAVADAAGAHDGALWDAVDWRTFYDERAGILEFDGGMSRPDAEALAFQATACEWQIQYWTLSEMGGVAGARAVAPPGLI
jgi:hypothetical protein